jgi:hypothetical protein
MKNKKRKSKERRKYGRIRQMKKNKRKNEGRENRRQTAMKREMKKKEERRKKENEMKEDGKRKNEETQQEAKNLRWVQKEAGDELRESDEYIGSSDVEHQRERKGMGTGRNSEVRCRLTPDWKSHASASGGT